MLFKGKDNDWGPACKPCRMSSSASATTVRLDGDLKADWENVFSTSLHVAGVFLSMSLKKHVTFGRGFYFFFAHSI
jgi:hypothetical protein